MSFVGGHVGGQVGGQEYASKESGKAKIIGHVIILFRAIIFLVLS